MIKIFRLADNEFIVQKVSSGIRIECDFKEAVKMLWILGVEMEEINVAMSELIVSDNDVADFGINNMFTYAKKLDRAA